MEKERSSKIIAIIALCVGVVGLSLGFASFASNLTIKSNASVTPNANTFNVDFSTTTGSIAAGNVTAQGSTTSTSEDAVVPTGTSATIDNSKEDSVISNISATFTEPGQTVTYTFYAHNGGEYDAYLNTVTLANAKDTTGNDLGQFRVCTPGTNTNADMVSAACNNINLSVKVNNDTFTSSQTNLTAEHKLAKGASESVVVTITYTGTALADGDFSVAFGDITLGYESVNKVTAN